MKPSQALQQHRDAILKIIARHRGLRPRVYGSVVRGEDPEGAARSLQGAGIAGS